mmetsp:Transcript_40693/g.88926  ORF Transcript_40693/g.88926 Transcript_40693/m.88926 type:complete len:203 (-) Transcript_40693:10-618(-)
MVSILTLELSLQLIDILSGFALPLLDLAQPLLLPPLLVNLRHKGLKGHLNKLTLGLFEPFLNLCPFCSHLEQIALHIGVLLQVPAEALVALLQPVRNVLNLSLRVQELGLVTETLELATRRNELLVLPLEVPLLLNDTRDLIAHKLGELITVHRGTRRNAREKTQFPQSFLQENLRSEGLNLGELIKKCHGEWPNGGSKRPV